MPLVLNISFILLTAVLYSLLVLGVTYANNQVGDRTIVPIYLMRFAFGGFLLVTGLLGIQGTFTDFSGVPPRMAFGIVPGFFLLIGFALLPITGTWLRVIPQWWLIGLQSFRVIVEVQLYELSKTPLLPKLMTFEGRNFDIVAGLAAILVAFLVRKAEKSGEPGKWNKLVVAFNVLGLVLLTNVVVHGILATPTQFQQIFVEPPNRAMGFFPFMWLPMFVVPFAYMLHIMSLRKLLMSGATKKK